MFSEIAHTIGTCLLGFFEKVKFLQTHQDRHDLALKAYEAVQRNIIRHINQSFAEAEIVLPDNTPCNANLPPTPLRKRQVYADPIVGWQNFCNGCPGWGILLGSYFDGVCEATVLYDPLSTEEYSAGLQQGAFLNRRRLRATNTSEVTIAQTSDLPVIRCRALAMAYTAAGRAERAQIASYAKASWEPMLVLLREARIRVVDGKAVGNNGKATRKDQTTADGDTTVDDDTSTVDKF